MSLFKQATFLIALLVIILFGVRTLTAAPALFAAAPSNCASNTGESATVAIQTSTNFQQDGQAIQLQAGDVIAAYSADGSLCAGSIEWAGNSVALAVWGNDSQTSAKDGLNAGEEIQFRVWRQQDGIEYTAEQVAFSQGGGTYAANAISILSQIVLPAPSSPPTVTPIPTPTPTPTSTPTSAAMSLELSPATQTIFLEQSTEIALNVVGADGLYGLQVSCTLQGNAVTLQTKTIENFFAADHLSIPGPSTNTQWDMALSQRNPAPALSGSGLFATLEIDSAIAGTATVSCTAEVSDRNGNALPITVSGASVTVIEGGEISGVLRYQTRPVDQASGINVTADGPSNGSETTSTDGLFTFDNMILGAYVVKGNVAGHLDVCHTDTLTEDDDIVVPLTIMQAGDANNDGTINMVDVVAVTSIFGSAPAVEFATDFNADGTVDIFDFAPLGGNFGESTNCIS